MRGKKAKKIRKYLSTNFEEALIIIRNNFGGLTTKMEIRGVYRNLKKLYKKGKLVI